MVRDETFSRSFMLLCFGAAMLFFFVQWHTVSTPTRKVGSVAFLPAKQKHALHHSNNGLLGFWMALFTQKPSATQATSSTRLLVDLSDRQVYVYRDNRRQTRYPVAVGQQGWETPTGEFQVLEMQRHPVWRHPITGDVVTSGSDNPLGDRWIGFWFDGQHHIGFHGTSEEELVGKAISHGCLRMRNQDIRTLYEQVSQGTPVVVRP